MASGLRNKKCKTCKQEFQPSRQLQSVCSPQCAYQLAIQKREKEEKKAIAQKRSELKTRSDYMREAQSAFNKYIRLRDANEPCISCGRFHTGQYHAGHYRSVGSSPENRFNEHNVHKQCQPCNTHLSGNLINYRQRLIHRIGVEAVERLEGKHEAKKYTVEELKEIKAKYTKLARELEKNGN